MGFVFERVGVQCDDCGLESEPVDFDGRSIDPCRESLRRDGWRVGHNDHLTCAECLEREQDDADMPGGFQ